MTLYRPFNPPRHVLNAVRIVMIVAVYMCWVRAAHTTCLIKVSIIGRATLLATLSNPQQII